MRDRFSTPTVGRLRRWAGLYALFREMGAGPVRAVVDAFSLERSAELLTRDYRREDAEAEAAGAA